MTYPSESDYPFEPFWADMRPGEALTAASFRIGRLPDGRLAVLRSVSIET